MKRIKNTERENIADAITNMNGVNFNMSEGKIDDLIRNEKVAKFNEEVDKLSEQIEKKNLEREAIYDQFKDTLPKAEIKPMFDRVLVKPFAHNPFQKVTIQNGLIVDTGGYTPAVEKNPMTGKYEEMKEFIVTGCVVEVGPLVKYLKEGDAIYYRKDTSVPVPFFKQGLVSLAESQIIAVVNEGLSERF